MQVANDVQSKKLTRKSKRNPKNWKRNISKENRQSGKAYLNCKGEMQPSRYVKTIGCSNAERCQFKCMTKINNEGRQAIFDSYWLLNDSEKRHFYVANVKRVKCKRKRTRAPRSQKSYNLHYYFNYMQEDIQVCQQFFVNTLNVNKGRIYYYFNQNKNKPTITPKVLLHGAHKKKVISEKQKQEVRDHINKFPVVESHYCRRNSKKNYLYQGLNVAKMYRLYVADTEVPVKLSYYRCIFNYEFNLSFFRPKKDRCDKCMAFELLTDPTELQINEQNLHLMRKANASSESDKDRKINHEDKRRATARISNASTVYYRRKFAKLNLTVAINKIIYNAMWDESLCGREGTHIANALIKILKRIADDNPMLEHLTLWSDSCVPQNRNSIMSAAIQYFLNTTESNLKKIDQKFSESGHGQVQEVDSAHSVIERFLRNKFIYSPPSLISEFQKLPENKLKFIVVPMEEQDYLDYQSLANAYTYTVIPFTKIKQLTYEKNGSSILAKFDFDQEFVERFIQLKPRSILNVGPIPHLKLVSKLSAAKISDIKCMFHIMPEADKQFYENIFKSSKLQVEIDDDSIATIGPEINQKPVRKVTTPKQKKSLPQIIPSKVSRKALSVPSTSVSTGAENVSVDSKPKVDDRVSKTPRISLKPSNSLKVSKNFVEFAGIVPYISITPKFVEK